jgi:hypothetical protein
MKRLKKLKMIIRVKTLVFHTTMNGGESDAQSKPPRMQD